MMKSKRKEMVKMDSSSNRLPLMDMTPVVRYYFEEQERLQECYQPHHVVVFLMVGKFYEVYQWEDWGYARLLSEWANIILTRKNKNLVASPSNPWMCGFPTTHVLRYIQILHQHDFHVAIINQHEDHSSERFLFGVFRPSFPVDYFFSLPGTPQSSEESDIRIEDSSSSINLSSSSSSFVRQGIVYLWFQKVSSTMYQGQWVFFDLHQGHVKGFEWQRVSPLEWWAEWDRCESLLSPREVQLFVDEDKEFDKEFDKHWKNEWEDRQRRYSSSLCSWSLSTFNPPSIFLQLSYQTQILEKVYRSSSSSSISSILSIQEDLHIERFPEWTTFFCYTLQLMYEHFPFVLQHLSPPQMWVDHEQDVLTWSGDIMSSLHLVQGSPSLFQLTDCTITLWGSQCWKQSFLRPSSCPEKMMTSWSIIGQFVSLTTFQKKEWKQKLSQCLSQPWIIWRRWEYGNYSKLSFQKMKKGWLAYLELATFVQSSLLPLFSNLSSNSTLTPLFTIPWESLRGIQDWFDQWIIDYEKENEQEQIPTVWRPMQKKYHLLQNEWLQTQQNFPTLCENAVRRNDSKLGCFYVLPRKQVKTVPSVWYKVDSRYYHPTIDQAWKQYQEKCQQFWKEHDRFEKQQMTEFMQCWGNSVKEVFEWMGGWDVWYSKVTMAEKTPCVSPVLHSNSDSNAQIHVTGLRHPIVETIVDTHSYQPHSLSWTMDSRRGYVVYGQNSAGKSTLLKSIALLVWLAQCGCYVPCESFLFSPVNHLFVKITSQDDLYRGQSTFVAEMMELRSLMDRVQASPKKTKYMILCDELTSGTEMYSACSIVASSIDFFLKYSVFFLYTTHLHWLPMLSLPSSVIFSYVDAKTRSLHEGLGDCIYGIEVAHQLQMNEEFVARAFHYRKQLLSQFPFHSINLTNLTNSTKTYEKQITMSKYFVNPTTSRYHSKLYMDQCQKCGSTSRLHTHHRRHQAESSSQGFIQHFHKNRLFNLQVLCESCHQSHHHEIKK